MNIAKLGIENDAEHDNLVHLNTKDVDAMWFNVGRVNGIDDATLTRVGYEETGTGAGQDGPVIVVRPAGGGGGGGWGCGRGGGSDSPACAGEGGGGGGASPRSMSL